MTKPAPEIGVALLGFGNVGAGSYALLTRHAAEIERRLGAKVRVRQIMVRDPKKRAPSRRACSPTILPGCSPTRR